MPVHCRNDYIEGMLCYIIEAQFLDSLPYLKLNAFIYFCGYMGPIMFTMLYNLKSNWIILAAVTTYLWFLPREIVKFHGLKSKQYFDVYWNRVAFMQIITLLPLKFSNNTISPYSLILLEIWFIFSISTDLFVLFENLANLSILTRNLFFHFVHLI